MKPASARTAARVPAARNDLPVPETPDSQRLKTLDSGQKPAGMTTVGGLPGGGAFCCAVMRATVLNNRAISAQAGSQRLKTLDFGQKPAGMTTVGGLPGGAACCSAVMRATVLYNRAISVQAGSQRLRTLDSGQTRVGRTVLEPMTEGECCGRSALPATVQNPLVMPAQAGIQCPGSVTVCETFGGTRVERLPGIESSGCCAIAKAACRSVRPVRENGYFARFRLFLLKSLSSSPVLNW